MLNGTQIDVNGLTVESRNTLTSYGTTYVLSPKAVITTNSDDPSQFVRSAQIVRILDKYRTQLMAVRIWGTWDEVEKFADEWLDELIRVNPTKGLSYTTEYYIHKHD